MGWEPPWKKLVEELEDEGFRSPYLDRLRERLPVHAEKGGLEREILQEMAGALGRAEDKVNAALLRLEVAEREVERAPDPKARSIAIREFNHLRQRALDVRRELLIHREALGFRRNDQLPALYPVPPRKHSVDP